jgi:ferric-dicitrate binding protein FerR (iron transport regulator)
LTSSSSFVRFFSSFVHPFFTFVVLKGKTILMDELNIAGLIAREIVAGSLPGEDQRRLAAWRAASAGNEACYRSCVEGEAYARVTGRYPVEEERERVLRAIALATRRRRTRMVRRWTGVAASVAMVVMAGYLLLERRGEVEESPVVATLVPGESRAELLLADGRSVMLGGNQDAVTLSVGAVEIRDTSNTLVYLPGKGTGDEEYNVLRTPASGEYRLSLPDGTLVYLNAGTRVRYPVAFSGETREVELSGEAYFEVARDTTRPFLVHTEGMSIRVLGTAFNVRAYAGQPRVAATLETGSVEVRCGEESHVLSPGMQAVRERATGRVEVSHVETRFYTSWREGHYYFEEMPLEEIMSTVAPWYGVYVSYRDEEARHVTFSGRLNRDSELGVLLRMFDETKEVEFVIDGKEIIVKKITGR